MRSVSSNELVALRLIAALGVALEGDQLAPAGTSAGWERDLLLRLSDRGLIDGDGGMWELTAAGREVLVMTERELAGLGFDAPAAEDEPEHRAALDRFSPDARKLVSIAKRESTTMGDRQIDTEHFLLALLRQGEGIVAEVFAANGITLDQARDAVRSLVITRANGEADGITFTLRARRMLTQALREALSTEQVEIDPRHILLALLDPRAGVASQVVRDLDLDAATISSALDIAGDRPDAWVSIKLQLIDWRIERLDAFILAAKSPPELLDTLSASSDDADTAAAIATLLDISEHAARYVIRQPIVRFTPAGIAAAERTRDNLARRRKKQVSQD